MSSDQTPAPSVRLKPTPGQSEDLEDRPITRRDIKLIMPTVLILLFTLVVIMTVIPYAFSSVIKQLKAVRALEAAGVYLLEFSDFYFNTYPKVV